MMRRMLAVLGACLMAFCLLSGCAIVTRLEGPGLFASGGMSGARFSAIVIDLVEREARGLPPFTLRFGEEGPLVRSDELTRELVSSHLKRRELPEPLRRKLGPLQVLEFEGHGYRIQLTPGGQPVSVMLCPDCGSSRGLQPVIGPADGDPLFALPLTEEEISRALDVKDLVRSKRDVY